MKDYKELSRNEFDKEAERFDQENKINIYKMCEKGYSYLIDEVKKEQFHSLLDVGCGTGNTISLLNDQFPNKKYTGMDLSENMIKVAKKKNISNASFMTGDAENMPFSNNQFDVIICKESFHHYPNVEKFFKECYRVLKNGGRLIIMDVEPPSKIIRWVYNHIILRFANKGDVHVYNIEETKTLYLSTRFNFESGKKVDKIRFICCGRK
ncbi:MAG: methyltransferase domain-containing protein [Clostridium butyricum]|nr:methyltransferase domain-containing protein [Clostridium butyricum]